ncbi:MAG: GHKL domain-containing protein, partial [Bacteroidia bacterium]|nr:GHKL domain-containing protein [Bacteroidia bacterium]
FEGDDGSIWLPAVDGGGGQGLNRINPRTGKIDNFLYSDILPDHYGINLLGAIRPGEFLFESTQGIKIYLTKTGQVIDSDFDLVKDQIPYSNELFIDKNSNIWLCTQSGLFRLRNKGIERFDLTEHEYSSGVSNEVTKVVESRRGGLWIQTNDGIFFIDETTEKIERHGHPGSGGDVLTSQDINALHEDKDGILWVGTWQGGLNRYNPETGEIKVYDIDSGLPSMSVQGILGDEKNGALWLSTFSGMSRFNIETEQFMNFTPADGAQSLLYADGAAYITSDGLFVFGGSMGINLFDPDDISENSLPPKVQITDFKIGSESMDAESINSATENPIALQHNQNNLSIDYTGIQHDNPSENRFAYRIDNYDDDWRDVGLLRSAYYYNLPPGEYNFQVIAANSNGVWSEPVSLAFNISPPWWRTWWAYLTYGFLIAAGLIYLDGWRKHQLVKKERALAKEKELEHAREIEKAYSELKSTQAQLIQSEKMASLGELTAGIAHEIQNPLNFVNNFSDVSNELLAEMKEEIVQGNTEDALEIVDDLSQNLSKINLHGDRASSIVQNMLQHSRPSSDEKIETDINALCDEFVRLSFHGLRAKDKTFNAAIETNFDKELPKLQVVAQDIGRVFLNIMNNAFYAVDQRNKRNENGFKPTVSISTKNKKEKIEISIKDNGSGIPPNQVDKIFEPFFTTKPTGKGTGLGLSLSYDIIKAHGGELKVESEIGKGSAFIIELPV